jgi:hypothetical protein
VHMGARWRGARTLLARARWERGADVG